MDRASVEAGLTVQPQADVRLTWNTAGTRLTVAPATAWSLGTYYTVSVPAGALDRSGHGLSVPVRAAFLVRSTPSTVLTAQATADGRDVRPEPTEAASVARLANDTGAAAAAGQAAGQAAGGAAKTAPATSAVAPRVVAITPAAKSRDVKPGTAISIAFSRPMNRSTTAAAFSLVVAGTSLPGSITWDDGDATLVFTPAAPLPAGAGVGVRVAGTATSVDGATSGIATSSTFRVVAASAPAVKPSSKPATRAASAPPARTTAVKPATKPKAAKPKTTKPAPTTPKTSTPKPPASAGSSSWIAVEAYYLELVNCTRTGGWVSSSGKCTGAGTRNVRALKLDAGISARVSRPYAKRLATRDICTHFSGGSPANRLRSAGFSSHRWAENLSCPHGMTASKTAVYSIRYFQNEKPYNGGHYRNLMNPQYERAGVGIWVAKGRVIIVTNFYKP